MTQFIQDLDELKQFPPESHILCPRQNDDDRDRYDDDDENPSSSKEDQSGQDGNRLAILGQGMKRRKLFLSSLQLFAFDGEETKPYQDYMWERLDEALGKCDICIRNYYVGKVRLQESLQNEYDPEEVTTFMKIFDDHDTKRVATGLKRAKATLEGLSEKDRKIAALDQHDLFALFESLSCDPLLRSEKLLIELFDEPFKLIQPKRPLKIGEYAPAATSFLFSSNSFRRNWAVQTWTKCYTHPPTDLEFDWTMKPTLDKQLQRIQNSPTSENITRFWFALSIITDSFGKREIENYLRTLNKDICALLIEHLSGKTIPIQVPLQVLKNLLEKAHDSIWDAMGAMPHATLIELIFSNHHCNKCFRDAANKQESLDSSLNVFLGWTEPFMHAVKAANQPAACRTMTKMLLQSSKSPENSNTARSRCHLSALRVILTTFASFMDEQGLKQGAVGRTVIAETRDTVLEHIDAILNPLPLLLEGNDANEIDKASMDIIRYSVNVECLFLRNDFNALTSNEKVQQGQKRVCKQLWKAVVDHLNEENWQFSSYVLLGLAPLLGLEKFNLRKASEEVAHAQKTFNDDFDLVHQCFAEILERLANFPPRHLDEIYRAQQVAMSAVSGLFSSDASVFQASVEMVKTVSGEVGRKDALAHLIDAFCATVTYAFCWCLRRVGGSKTFSPVPNTIKVIFDILEVFCDSSNGILRNRTLEARESDAIKHYWKYQWHMLGTVFDCTEQWAEAVGNKEKMTELCRDTMQFAESLFSEYDVFAAASTATAKDKETSDTIKKGLLDSSSGSPALVLRGMSRWLRLRDEYLVITCVELIRMLLRRLGDKDIKIADDSLSYIKDLSQSSGAKSKLTMQQKAELVQALEKYTGQEMEVVHRTTKKQRKLTQYIASSDDSVRVEKLKSVIGDEFGDDDIADEDLYKLSESVEMNKALRGKTTAGVKPSTPEPFRSKSAKPQPQAAGQRQAFLEARRKDLEARKQRDREAAALLRGQSGVGLETKGQGSGIKGIGVAGKDHTKRSGEGMMISSESESESEDDMDKEIFGTFKKSTDGKLFRDAAGPKSKAAAPVKVNKQIRTEKQKLARVAPDLSSLHKAILDWDYFADTEVPPNSATDDYSAVQNVFGSVLAYQKSFEPLLILEAWQGLRSAREDNTFKPFGLKVINRLTVDQFIEISTSMSFAEGKDLGLGEADLMLLSQSKRPENAPSEPHCLARINKIQRKKGQLEISYRITTTNNRISSLLGPGAELSGIKLLSLTPLEREYGSLIGLQFYDLVDEIIRAKPSPILKYSSQDVEPFISSYTLNNAQARAVKSAMDNDAFTLIQGPPGSGKTKTICALVGAILTTAKNNRQINSNRGFIPPRGGHVQGNKKLLVCAPSNAAVDELVMRFKEGVRTMTGSVEKVSVVRLGRSEAINANVKDLTLEELVSARLDALPKDPNQKPLGEIMAAHKDASEKALVVRAKLDASRSKGERVNAEDEREFELWKKKKSDLGSIIDDRKRKENTASRDSDIARRKIQQQVLDEADILCATLSGSGHEMFRGLDVEFETVIIDEAAQSIELSALIPLKYGCSKCILVGDPKQLPPTVLSRMAAQFQYEQSLFARMAENHPNDVHLLDTQYRMHPEISLFPSNQFYDSRLKDGKDMAKLRSKPWHNSSLLGPYRFFDVEGMHQSAVKGHSLVNIAEIKVAMQLYDRLITDCRGYNFRGKIGIITPYKGQLKELKINFSQRYGEEILSSIEFNTTDAFQGRESEIIIFSCVRASTGSSIGFLSDIRRMNVGLTRAKSSLWVLGNSQSLMRGEFWSKLVKDAQKRDFFTGGDIMTLLSQQLVSRDMMKPDVEMADVDMIDVDTGTAVSHSPATSPIQPSKASNGPLKPTNAHSLPSNPKSGTQGISGSKNDLNSKAQCSHCGSNDHFSRNCDASDAQKSYIGKCHRCGSSSHSASDCRAERCLDCGHMGHVAANCSSDVKLDLQQRCMVAKQEESRRKHAHQGVEKARARQLGEHGAKTPVVKSTASTPSGPRESTDSNSRLLSSGHENGKRSRTVTPSEGKRKREGSIDHAGTVKGQAGKTETRRANYGSDSDRPAKLHDGDAKEHVSRPAQDPSKGPTDSHQQVPRPRPNPVVKRRKQEDALFMKSKKKH
ncbi:MAG: hypothetical protein Q9160_001120 [Pyrenula sp. 1 TL-2023]